MLGEKLVIQLIKKISFGKENNNEKKVNKFYPMEFFVGGNL